MHGRAIRTEDSTQVIALNRISLLVRLLFWIDHRYLHRAGALGKGQRSHFVTNLTYNIPGEGVITLSVPDSVYRTSWGTCLFLLTYVAFFEIY